MPVGGVADEILVTEGEQVKAGQVLMKLDTEAEKSSRNLFRPRCRRFRTIFNSKMTN